MKNVYINDWVCVSNLGFFSSNNRGIITSKNSHFNFNENNSVKVACIPGGLIEQKSLIHNKFEKLDRTVQIALFLASKLNKDTQGFGISIGSSRAATGNFEKYYKNFIESKDVKLSPLSSPLTTHGNVSSEIANYLNNDEGVNIEHSVTCSSGVYSIIDAISWINSGFLDNFIAGGIEAPLTDFTIAQMKALKIYSESECYPFQNLKNTFLLGEGGALFILSNKKQENSLACISGFGSAHEKTNSLTAMSSNAVHMQKSMKKAIKDKRAPDIILAHAPGTLKGDLSELNAIRAVFPKNIPFIYSSKYIHGHTFGASGAISLALGIEILNTQEVPNFSYKNEIGYQKTPKAINSILINTTGFGGNAISLLIEKI